MLLPMPALLQQAWSRMLIVHAIKRPGSANVLLETGLQRAIFPADPLADYFIAISDSLLIR